MTNSFEDFVDSLIENPEPIQTKTDNPKYARRKFTCESCGGTGFWRGGKNRHGNSKCNTCHGKGFLVTSPEARAKARDYARKSKQSKIAAAQEANLAHGDGFLHQWLKEVSSWNNFAASLIEQHNEGKTWSDKQVEACRNMYRKWKERNIADQEAKAKREAAAPVVDLARIRAMFDTVMSHGYKRPMYRADGLRIKPGKGGALYVLNENRTEYGHFGEQPGYEGKITEDNKFFSVKKADPETAVKLTAIAKDPLGAAVRYGRATGRCACCGRELTKHESIERGVGPICAERWGLADAELGWSPKAAAEELDTLLKGS